MNLKESREKIWEGGREGERCCSLTIVPKNKKEKEKRSERKLNISKCKKGPKR